MDSKSETEATLKESVEFVLDSKSETETTLKESVDFVLGETLREMQTPSMTTESVSHGLDRLFSILDFHAGYVVDVDAVARSFFTIVLALQEDSSRSVSLAMEELKKPEEPKSILQKLTTLPSSRSNKFNNLRRDLQLAVNMEKVLAAKVAEYKTRKEDPLKLQTWKFSGISWKSGS